MKRHESPFAVVVGVLLAGCAGADFELGTGVDDAASDVADVASIESAVIEDGGAPPSDAIVDSSPASDVLVADGCVANACGGCTPLAKTPGTVCGMCGTSAYACTGATTTECSAPDDRTDGSEVVNDGADQTAVVLTPSTGAAVSFTMPRAGSLTSVSLAIGRSDYTSSGDAGVVGRLRVRVIKGVPSLTPALTAVLADGLIPETSFPTGMAILTLTLPPGSPILGEDQAVWIELTANSDHSRFQLFGSSSSDAPPVLDRTTTGYVRNSSVNAYLELGMRACW